MDSSHNDQTVDLNALAWVQEELRKSLEGAHKSLRRCLKDAESAGNSDVDDVDPAVLRSARQHMHQCAGALQMLSLRAGAVMLHASENAIQRFVPKPQKLNAAAVEAIEKASFAVLDYIARLLAGKTVSAVALFPQYEAVQKVAGAERIHPADLWQVDWQWRDVPTQGVASRAADTNTVNDFEAQLLSWMRNQTPEAARALAKMCAGLAASSPDAAAMIWKLAAGFFEGASEARVVADVHAKRVTSRLLSQLRHQVRGTTNPDPQAAERLAQELLFFCAQAGDEGKKNAVGSLGFLGAVRNSYQLAGQKRVDYTAQSLGRFDPTWVALARKRVVAAKEAWSSVAGGELVRLSSLGEQFSLVGESLHKLYNGGDVLAEALQQVVTQTAHSGAEPAAPVAMEVATSVLYLEASLEDGDFDSPEQGPRVKRLAQRLNAVAAGQPPEPLEDWMEELYRRVSDKQTIGSVVHELRTSLSDAEKNIDLFFRNVEDRSVLVSVPAQLQSMRGVLSVLGIGQAAQAVHRMRDDVEMLMLPSTDVQQAGHDGMFDRLASNLGALGFLVDMLGVQPHLAKSLFAYDAKTGLLHSLMGQRAQPPAPVPQISKVAAATPSAAPSPVARQAPPPPSVSPSPPPVAVPAPAPASVDAPLSLSDFPAAAATPARAAPPRVEPSADQVAMPRADVSLTLDLPDLDFDLSAAEPATSDAPAIEVESLNEAVQAIESFDASVHEPLTLDFSSSPSEFESAAPAMQAPVEVAAVEWSSAPVPEPLAVAPPAPKPAPLMPAPVAAPIDTGLEEDDEMRAIFLEEAREVIATARDAIKQLHRQPSSMEDLTVVRRGFHTLKGSSRMVGLKDYGEAGWACEQLFNAWLATQQPAGPDLLSFTGAALSSFDAWVDEIEARRDDGHRRDPLIRSADALRLEGRLLPLDSVPAAPAAAQPSAGPSRASELAADRSADLAAEPSADIALDILEPAADAGLQVLNEGDAQALALSQADAPQVVETIEFGALAVDGDSLLEPAAFGDGAADPGGELSFALPPIEEPQLEPAAESEAEPSAGNDQVKVIGHLRIGIPLFNVYLNEADEQSRTLSTELAEWAMQCEHPVTDHMIALAHSLAGNSSTVGFQNLSQLARTLEHLLGRSQALGLATIEEAMLFSETADEMRRLLHQFAAGFLKTAQPALLERLAEFDRNSALRMEELSLTQGYGDISEDSGPMPLLEPVSIDEPLVLDDESVVADTAAQALEEFRKESTALADVALPELPEVSEPVYDAPAEPASPLDFALEEFVQAQDQVGQLDPSDPFAGPVELVVAPPATQPVADEQGGPQASPVDRTPAPAPHDHATLMAPVELGLPEFRDFASLPQASPEQTVHVAPRAAGGGYDDDIDATDAVDAELFPIFEEEALELLPELSGQMRDWIANPTELSAASACMRTLHTFKGGARLAGAMRVGEMAHRMETAVEKLLARGSITAADVEEIQNHSDALSEAFEVLRSTDATSYDQANRVAEIAAQLPPAAPVAPVASVLPTSPASAGRAETAPAAAEPALLKASPGKELAPLPQPIAAAQGQPAVIDWSRFTGGQLAKGDAGSRRVAASQAAVRVRSQLLDRLVNQAGEVSISRSRLASEVGTIKTTLGDLTDNLDRLRHQLRDIELHSETQMASRMEAARVASQSFDPLEFDRFTRFQEITRMMAESVNDVATVQRSLQRTLDTAEDQLVAQARLTRDLQDDLLRTRMVEFEGLSERLYRVVRQAGKETGKQVRLDIVGGATEVDRGVLDRMTPSFEHLLRNCVTHGIEAPEVRQALGKDPSGTILVTLRQEGNEVSVEFRDDGAGLNLKRILEKGRALGMVQPNQQPTEAELAQLIFMPGFSTAETITELAGRGVGMDVVRNEINSMGGRIETSTAAGKGTSFKLVLPLTTAVTKVVMMRCGDILVAVPTHLIEIVRRAKVPEVEKAYASGLYQFGDLDLPFFWLGALLQGSAYGSTEGRSLPVVVVRSASQRVALHIDEVLGNQEVIVKNLGPQLSRLPGLAGMTLLASGAVALIYNPVALATVYGDAARQMTQAARQHATLPVGEDQMGLTGPDGQLVHNPHLPMVPPVEVAPVVPLILVVDDSLTVRRVTQRLLAREGYRVTLAKDGLDALERLAEERPALVLSDIEMPRMDGFDLVRNIRADSKLADLPVIMITSRIAQKHREYAAELGVDHYLGKPYNEEELLSLIARYTAQEAPQEADGTY